MPHQSARARFAPLTKLAAMVIATLTCAQQCPPPQPPTGQCDVALNNIQSVKLSPNSGPVLVPPGGTQKTLAVQVSAPGTQAANVAFCFAVVAGDLQTNRATDNKLGGMVLFGDGAGNFTSSFDVRCNAEGKVEVLLVDPGGTPAWKTTGTRENNLYILTLPANLISPASNTVDVKCQ
jgi:hypothetical protein